MKNKKQILISNYYCKHFCTDINQIVFFSKQGIKNVIYASLLLDGNYSLNFKGPRHQGLKIKGLENMSLSVQLCRIIAIM